MKQVSYVLANRANANVVPAAVAWRIIDTVEAYTYLEQLFAHKNSGINSIKDITKTKPWAKFQTRQIFIPL